MPFVKIAAASPVLYLGDPLRNAQNAINLCQLADQEGVAILLFPELSLTGISCGDYFLHEDLLSQAREALNVLIDASKAWPNLLFTTGLPWDEQGRLYLLTLLIQDGRIIQARPRLKITPNPLLKEAPDLLKLFTSGEELVGQMNSSLGVPFSNDSLQLNTDDGPLRLTLLPGQDLWYETVQPGLILHPFARAALPQAEDHYRKSLQVKVHALGGEILAAGSGKGESTSDFYYRAAVYHVSEDQTLSRKEALGSSEASDLLISGIIPAERIGRARLDRRPVEPALSTSLVLNSASDLGERILSPHPLFPHQDLPAYIQNLVEIQQASLHRRLRTLQGQKVVLGFSSGLDSTLTLLSVRDYYLKTGRPLEDLLAYTLPGPGSSQEGFNLAIDLMETLGIEARVIEITAAVEDHLDDIGQPENLHDVTFENAQARERTQVLMDLANRHNGLVVGTGDLSEKALGWSTYNGDHMSMYELNHGIPKTLIPHIILTFDVPESAKPLIKQIVNRPISPELLPSGGEELQSTELALGPYALHDFFIYHTEVWGASSKTLFELAKLTFSEANIEKFTALTGVESHGGVADSLHSFKPETIAATLDIFRKRFSRNQFKRSASAEGVQIGPASYAPRQGRNLPSDFFGDFSLKS